MKKLIIIIVFAFFLQGCITVYTIKPIIVKDTVYVEKYWGQEIINYPVWRDPQPDSLSPRIQLPNKKYVDTLIDPRGQVSIDPKWQVIDKRCQLPIDATFYDSVATIVKHKLESEWMKKVDENEQVPIYTIFGNNLPDDTIHYAYQFPLPPSFEDYKIHSMMNGKFKYYYQYDNIYTYSIWLADKHLKNKWSK